MSDEAPFPYEYGSDLHWLWGWGTRIEGYLAREGYRPNANEWMVFRPDNLAANAMLRFSADFPAVIEELRRCLQQTDHAFDDYLCLSDSENAEILTDRLLTMVERIRVATELIAQREFIQAAEKIADSTTLAIPLERRTKPISLAEAGTRLGLQPPSGSKDARREAAGKAVKRLIDSGGVRCEPCGTKFVFDKTQVPDE